MRLVKACAFAFSRRGKNSESKHSYEEIVDEKARRMKYYEKKYDFYELFQHEDKYFEEYVYGNTCFIAGVTNNNYESQVYTKSMMDFVKPNLLLLGGISDNYFRLYENFLKIRQFYQHPLYKAQKMGCKERVSRLIQERLEKDDNFFWDDFQKEIRIINTQDKRIQPNDYLTASHIASLDESTKVALGKPSDTLVFQDLIMRYSVQELKDIAQSAVNKSMENRSK